MYELVPLMVEINFKPRPQNRIFVSLRGLFQNLRRVHPSLLYGSPSQGFFVVLPIVSSLNQNYEALKKSTAQNMVKVHVSLIFFSLEINWGKLNGQYFKTVELVVWVVAYTRVTFTS